MLQEFSYPVGKRIETNLNLLVDSRIISHPPWRQSAVTEFALRNSRYFSHQVFPEDAILKIKTLFGVPTKPDFYGPNRDRIINDVSVAFNAVKPNFPGFQGLMLFGSRMNVQKAPRNTRSNPSDIDAVAVFDNKMGDLISWELLKNIELQIRDRLNSNHKVFQKIPFNLKTAERVETIFLRLNPSYFTKPPYWAVDPDGTFYLGEMHFGRKHNFNQDEVNRLITTSISSPSYQDLRIREVHHLCQGCN